MDLNHRPLPYQGSALTKLSYRPETKRQTIGPRVGQLTRLQIVGQHHFQTAGNAHGEVVHKGKNGGQE
jgi:hypothetical protein